MGTVRGAARTRTVSLRQLTEVSNGYFRSGGLIEQDSVRPRHIKQAANRLDRRGAKAALRDYKRIPIGRKIS